MKVGHTLSTTSHVTGNVPFTTQSSRAAWSHFRPLAQRVPAAGLAPFNQDVALARHNIAIGLAAVRAQPELLAARCPTIALDDLLELPALALALDFAAGRVPAAKMSDGEIAALTTAIKQPRQDALAYLEIAARQGLVPMVRVRAQRDTKGQGRIKLARSCVQIVGLFDEFEDALRGRHPFTEAFLQNLGAQGERLAASLKPARAKRTPDERSPEAIERDQFAKLLADRYKQLRVAGVNLFGVRDLDAKVPPLYSGTVVANAEVAEDTTEAPDTDDAPDA